MAPTGIAAESLGGCSIHSFFGIGVPRIRKDFQKMWSERIRHVPWIGLVGWLASRARSFGLDVFSNRVAWQSITQPSLIGRGGGV
jgi:hypothetical protein